MRNARIRFGTDGWRGVIAEDFTFERVRLVTAALTETLAASGAEGGTVVVGFDRRFLSPDFARAVSEVLAGAGFHVLLANEFVPTPAVSLAVRNRKAVAGIVVTASHNPARWNGFKLKESFGGSARNETTAKLEAIIARKLDEERPRIPRLSFDEATRRGRIERVDLGAEYLTELERLVDLRAIARAGFRVVADPIHGAGAGYLARALRPAGADVTEIRATENPCFGGVNPEPIEENLGELRAVLARMRDGTPAIGLAFDGDADRIGAIDEQGEFFDSHRIFATVLRHLSDVRGLSGKVVQTVSSTVMVRRLAERRGLERIETPIGFKYVADHMLAGGVLMGGEESGGLGFSFHIPERDGALSGLLLLEACAKAGLPPRALLEQVFAEVGPWHYGRIDVQLNPARSAEIVSTVKSAAPERIAGAGVASRNDRDGVKFSFTNDSWLLLRPSGTEPVLRIYAEAETPDRVGELLTAGRALAGIE